MTCTHSDCSLGVIPQVPIHWFFTSSSRGVPRSRNAQRVRAKGFVIATGYGALKDDMVRIGHMGEHSLGEVEAVLEALGEVLD